MRRRRSMPVVMKEREGKSRERALGGMPRHKARSEVGRLRRRVDQRSPSEPVSSIAVPAREEVFVARVLPFSIVKRLSGALGRFRLLPWWRRFGAGRCLAEAVAAVQAPVIVEQVGVEELAECGASCSPSRSTSQGREHRASDSRDRRAGGACNQANACTDLQSELCGRASAPPRGGSTGESTCHSTDGDGGSAGMAAAADPLALAAWTRQHHSAARGHLGLRGGHRRQYRRHQVQRTPSRKVMTNASSVSRDECMANTVTP